MALYICHGKHPWAIEHIVYFHHLSFDPYSLPSEGNILAWCFLRMLIILVSPSLSLALFHSISLCLIGLKAEQSWCSWFAMTLTYITVCCSEQPRARQRCALNIYISQLHRKCAYFSHSRSCTSVMHFSHAQSRNEWECFLFTANSPVLNQNDSFIKWTLKLCEINTLLGVKLYFLVSCLSSEMQRYY